MQKNLSLEAYYQQYTHGKLNKKQLEGIIFQFVLKNYKQFYLYGWSEGECIDYLCWLYPRISRTIDRYSFSGSSFDMYIRALIRWSSKEYRTRESNHRIIESACWDARAADMMVCDREPEYPEPEKALKPVSNPRQILVLLLKSYYYVSEDFINRVAPAIGIEREELTRMVETLRKRRLERDEHIHRLRERLHSQYYRCITFERRMLAATEGSAREALMRRCLEKSRRRLTALRKRIRMIRFDATNRQVADILGVPKGTVDSSLFAVKAKQRSSAAVAEQIPAGAGEIPDLEDPQDCPFGLN
ncbi:MAG: hypothetical protein LBQ38_05240 [Spirochaetaceae bacterium]|jgi:hypothetical protein|nr:hypothetical protein [Spirochaetaceae bacterium]